MKSYREFCAVARSLDLVGDRWTLLIVRELLIGPRRYTDLLDGLPGIARNLLADRMRSLTDAGLVAHREGRHRLTPRGEELRPVIRALARFGAPELARGAHGDAVRGAWALTALDARFPDQHAVRLISAGKDEVVLEIDGRQVSADPEALMTDLAADELDATAGSQPREPSRARSSSGDQTMSVNHVLAGVAVADVAAALPWYERLFGRPADVRPMDGLAEWHIPSGGVLQLVASDERAGRSVLTLDFDDLEDQLAAMRERGLEAGALDDTTSDKVRIASLTDPEGNAITLIERRRRR